MIPKITIITASFNSAKTIEDTIKSVLAQTFNNYEYVIVDGKSKDETVDIIKRYEPLFGSKLKWISEPDSGIYDAWNKAIKMSTGEWVCFLGSDDMLMPNALELYAKHDDGKVNYISSRVELITPEKKHIRYIGVPWSKKMLWYSGIAHVASWHKRQLYENYGLYDLSYKICADYEFLIRCHPHLVPGFFSDVTAMMRDGGVSHASLELLSEENRRIKQVHNIGNAFTRFLWSLRCSVAGVVKGFVKCFNKLL